MGAVADIRARQFLGKAASFRLIVHFRTNKILGGGGEDCLIFFRQETRWVLAPFEPVAPMSDSGLHKDTPRGQQPDDQYIAYARDCERLARLSSDPHIREQLLQMAREWMAAAMHEPKPPQPEAPELRPRK